jgi:hypothetical protein
MWQCHNHLITDNSNSQSACIHYSHLMLILLPFNKCCYQDKRFAICKIKMDLQKVGWGRDWIQLAQGSDRWQILVNVVTNLRIP